MSAAPTLPRGAFALAVAAAAVLLGASALQRGWITEDAFITFRTVENLLDGHGLRWNLDERVQVYTHPLWMLLLVPLRAVFGELYWSTILLSVGLSVAAFLVAVVPRGDGGAAAPEGAEGEGPPASPALPLLLGLLLLLSKAFNDFATSGLETPLTWLLVALFWKESGGPARPGRLALYAALLATNRHDAVLLVLPGLVPAALAAWRTRGLRSFLLGFWPIAAWELFSLVYYGFLFPNTAWAKLASGVPSADLAYQGALYALDLLVYDPVSAVLILLPAAAASALWGAEGPPRRPLEGGTVAMALGVLLSAVYVVKVGGDFMSGRFFAPAVFQGALAVHHLAALGAKVDGRAPTLALAAAAGLALLFPRAAIFGAGNTNIAQSGSKVVDERAFWSATNNLGSQGRAKGYQDNPASQAGAAAKLSAQGQPAGQRLVISDKSVGMLGYFAGPEVVVLDPAGLTDPLIARLPLPTPDSYWRPGHFLRELPVGYDELRRSGDAGQMHPSLAAYEEKLRLITSGPLLSSERLGTIVAFNLGAYEDLRQEYIAARGQDNLRRRRDDRK